MAVGSFATHVRFLGHENYVFPNNKLCSNCFKFPFQITDRIHVITVCKTEEVTAVKLLCWLQTLKGFKSPVSGCVKIREGQVATQHFRNIYRLYLYTQHNAVQCHIINWKRAKYGANFRLCLAIRERAVHTESHFLAFVKSPARQVFVARLRAALTGLFFCYLMQ